MNLLLIFLIIIIQATIIGLLYKKYNTITQPAVFFQLYTTIQIIIAMIAFDSEYEFNGLGITWILLALFFFSIGSILASKVTRTKFPPKKYYQYSIKTGLAEKILIISIVLGFGYTMNLILEHGFTVAQLFNFDNLIEINEKMASERYFEGKQDSNIISRVFLTFTYFAPLVGGYNLIFTKNKKSKLLCVVSLLPAFLSVLIQNTKAAWIGAVFIFISGYIVANVKVKHGLPIMSIKKTISIIIGIITFLGICYGSMLMRIGSFDLEIIEIVNKKFLLYALGHIPGFDIWFSDNYCYADYTLGLKTFYGISNFLGISERAQGIYTNFVSWGSYETNVYSIFRPYMEDFGVFLGTILMLVYGFLMSLIFIYQSKAKTSCITLLAAFYFYTLHSFTSTWAYASYILVYFLFAIYIKTISVVKEEK